MTFQEVYKEFQEGRRIRLPSWEKGVYVSAKDTNQENSITIQAITSNLWEFEPLKREDLLMAIVEHQREYIELIGDELDEVMSFAANHGWTSTRVEDGLRLREDIKSLTDQLVTK